MKDAIAGAAGPGEKLILYGTSACHLCEVARALLNNHHATISEFEYSVSDISESDELFQRYGMRIPVLRRADEAELDWPFSASQLRVFLKGG